MATRSLSPKRFKQKLREHRTAVATLAMINARRAVKDQIRARGLKVAHFTAKEISILAEDYVAQHREQLRAEAEHTIATWPGFARWRLPRGHSNRHQAGSPSAQHPRPVEHPGCCW